MTMAAKHGALLVADAPGHILERLGKSWMRHQPQMDFKLVCSAGTHPLRCCWLGLRQGLIHWLDTRRFVACGSASPVPQVVMVHHLVEETRAAELAALVHADAITTASRYWQGVLERETKRRVWLTPYGVDARVFCPAKDRVAGRREAGIREEEFVIGFVGKALADVAGRKGTEVLLEVLTAARTKWPEICLLLVGPGWEELTAKVQALGVRVVRREYPDTESTLAAYRLMDVLLVTSSVEGGPCTVLEAMATEVPVVTSKAGHVPEVVVDGVTGFICPQRTVAEYVEKLTALRGDAELRRRMGAAAREHILRERDDGVVVVRFPWEEIYREAREHYARRKLGERMGRVFPVGYFGMRLGKR